MNSRHDSIEGRLFYDPSAEENSRDGGNTTPAPALANPDTAGSPPAPRTSEEIHRTLFSAR